MGYLFPHDFSDYERYPDAFPLIGFKNYLRSVFRCSSKEIDDLVWEYGAQLHESLKHGLVGTGAKRIGGGKQLCIGGIIVLAAASCPEPAKWLWEVKNFMPRSVLLRQRGTMEQEQALVAALGAETGLFQVLFAMKYHPKKTTIRSCQREKTSCGETLSFYLCNSFNLDDLQVSIAEVEANPSAEGRKTARAFVRAKEAVAAGDVGLYQLVVETKEGCIRFQPREMT